MRTILIFIFICSNVFAQNSIRTISYFESSDIKSIDKINNSQTILSERDKIPLQRHSFLNLSGQAIVGPVFGIGFSIFPLYAAWLNALSSRSSETLQYAFGILTISSYLFGSAVGVHLVAKSENPKLSFWGTVGYSVIGGGISIVLASILASQYETIPGGGVLIIALCPTISSMIYASFISDWPQENQKIPFNKNNISHKDFIEQTKLINIELLRFKL